MKLVRWTFLFLLVSGVVVAQDIKLVGSIDQVIKLPRSDNRLNKAMPDVKHVTLLKVELSDKARQIIDNRAVEALNANAELSAETTASPGKIQLGMGTVPVLDQGNHGSCVTFAVTGAIDAALSKGDYISQLCLLELGNHLEKNAYIPSGWNGSLGDIVLGQVNTFGIVSKTKQKAHGCGGMTEYPLRENDPDSEMTLAEYHQISESVNRDVVASIVLDFYQAFLDKTNTNDTLNQVKEALSAGDRLTFGVLLPEVDLGVAGAVGKTHAKNDSWVLTPEIAASLETKEIVAAHQMIIIGYDDDAVAVDQQGRKYQGLFTLRNSWGQGMGDKGNFYMSYDYFKTLADEVQRIRHLDIR